MERSEIFRFPMKGTTKMKTSEEIEKMLANIDDNNRKRETFDEILERRSSDDDDAISLPTKPNDEVWFRKQGDKEKSVRASLASFVKQEGDAIVLLPLSPMPRWIERFVCSDGYIRMSASRILPSPEIEKRRNEVKEFNEEKELDEAVVVGAQGMPPVFF